MLNFGLVFMTLSLSLGVNLEEGFLRRLGFDPDVLMLAVVAFVISGLVVHRRLALIVVVVLLAIGANAPPGVAESLGYDPDIALAALFGVVTVPYMARMTEAF